MALPLAATGAAGPLFSATSARPPTLPGAPGCPVFPSDNHWNQRVDGLPLHPRSDAIVRSIGLAGTMHADFGSGLWEGGPIGIPFTTVGAGRRGVRVSFRYASESDRVRYPIPRARRSRVAAARTATGT